MTAKKLPTKLRKEPLIDVVCGVNFDSDVPGEALLPGLLLSKLAGKQPRFESLPVAQLPKAMRDIDPKLQNAPLMRVVIDEQFTVLIGSKWLGVGCQMPYAGWQAFKGMIQTVFAVLKDAGFVKGIVRHSLKYVDFIRNNADGEPLARFNLNIEVAGRKLSGQATQFRTELLEEPFLHATTIISQATAVQPDGMAMDGAVLEVDTHRIETFTLDEFLRQLPQLLDNIHIANKNLFFDLLSESGLNELEPVYDE